MRNTLFAIVALFAFPLAAQNSVPPGGPSQILTRGAVSDPACELAGNADCEMVGQIRANFGTAALPGVAFNGDTSTGMLSGGSGILGFSTSGVQRYVLTTSALNGILPFNVAVPSTGSGPVLTGSLDAASTGTVLELAKLTRTTTGTPGTGIGASLAFEVEKTAGVLNKYTLEANKTTSGQLGLNFNEDGTTRFSFNTSNGGVLVANSNGNLAFSDFEQPTTGIGFDASNTIFLDSGATQVLQISSTLGILMNTGQEIRADDSGTAAAPAITFDGDTDTGLFRQAANAIGMSAGGVERVRVTTTDLRPISDNVTALGTDALAYSRVDANVVVAGDGTAAAPSMVFDTNENLGLFRSGANTIGVSVAGVSELTISGTELAPSVASGQSLGTDALPFARTDSALIVAGDGSVAAPSIVFDSVETTGFARNDSGTGEINVVVNGDGAASFGGSLGRVLIVTNDGNGGQIDSWTRLGGVVSATASTQTMPTCSVAAGTAGAVMFIDDTNDGKPSVRCECQSDSTDTYSWAGYSFVGGVPTAATCPP